jgi:hypothetical protein
MSNPNIPLADAAFAEFFSLTTRALKHLPPLDRLITGVNNVPDGWRRIGTPARELAPWIEFEGDPNATSLPIPSLYEKCGLVTVQASQMERLQRDNPGARQALAVAFGEAVVVGALAEGRSFSYLNEQSDDLLVGSRIGRGDLRLRVGAYLPGQKQFLPASTNRRMFSGWIERAEQQGVIIP